MPRTKRNDESVDSSCLRGHTDGRLCRLGLARLAFSENVIGLGGPDKGFGLTIMFFDIREGSILGELPFREIRLPNVTFPPPEVHRRQSGALLPPVTLLARGRTPALRGWGSMLCVGLGARRLPLGGMRCRLDFRSRVLLVSSVAHRRSGVSFVSTL